jgi:glutathione S-transferase
MIILYEHSTSVCVIKVRLTLAEKGIDYEGRYVDIHRGEQFDPEYLAIHPGAVVPALVHDGEVILESSVIQYYLDDVFADPPMMPRDPLARYRVRRLIKMIDDPIHPACGVLTHAIAFRKAFRTPDAIDARMAKIPDPRRRARQRSVYEQGIDSPLVIDAVGDFDRLLGEMETTLAGGAWLGGDIYSLADAAATPYVNRLAMLGLLDAWRDDHPRVMDWYDRIRARPSFEVAVTRWFSEADAERFAPFEPDAADKVRELLRSSPTPPPPPPIRP